MANDPLLRRLNELRWPTLALDCPEPAAGQLWRVEWERTACLVVIVGQRTGRMVPVMAATSDSVGDDKTLGASTENGMVPSVWGGTSGHIKTFTLAHRITNLTSDSLVTLTAVAANKQPGGWAPITSILDDRVLVRADLTDNLRDLGDAEWLQPTDESAPTLAELSSEADLRPSQIAECLGITPGAARRLLQGHQQPSPDEVQALSGLLGPVSNFGVRFDDDMVATLDLPAFRPRLRLIANEKHNGNEPAARRAAAQRVMATAARHRGSGPRNWAALIDGAIHAD